MRSIRSIIIANRGEIASRIIRTCRKMGIRSIAVFSEADRDAPYVSEADTAVFIGESSPANSYLNQDKIFAVAKKAGAEAIHPGYGFLAENAAFARRCKEEGLIFIGPHPEAIAAMGSKSKAKTLMREHGVPIIPGYQGEYQSSERLAQEAKAIGFPVLLKAAAGGGGKGMRIIHNQSETKAAIEAAKREARSAFGEDELIIEKYISKGRHIEFQIFGDQHGNAIHLLERECTIQRRYQKIIEESPSPVMDEMLRADMGEAAVKAARALRYDNAGTVEFIYDESNGDFYFLEINTRLQVEHPVTEAITGLDLVQMQIETAQGMPLSISQEEVKGKGYAVELRLYAEDPNRDFLPVTGTVHRFEVPEVDSLRVETAIRSGSEISIFYDPMIAKLIIWDTNRQAAHQKMQYVLRKLVCLGTTTNQHFLLDILENEDFLTGNYDTHFVEKLLDQSAEASQSEKDHSLSAIAACLHSWWQREQSRTLLKSLPSGWRNNFNDYQEERYLIGEQEFQLRYRFMNGGFQFKTGENDYAVQLIHADANQVRIENDNMQHVFQLAQAGRDYFIHSELTGSVHLKQLDRFPQKKTETPSGGYEAPMPSQVVKVLVEAGQTVSAGEGLVVLSSMKMENTIEATADGVVDEVYATEGAHVAAGFLLLKLVDKKYQTQRHKDAKNP